MKIKIILITILISLFSQTAFSYARQSIQFLKKTSAVLSLLAIPGALEVSSDYYKRSNPVLMAGSLFFFIEATLSTALEEQPSYLSQISGLCANLIITDNQIPVIINDAIAFTISHTVHEWAKKAYPHKHQESKRRWYRIKLQTLLFGSMGVIEKLMTTNTRDRSQQQELGSIVIANFLGYFLGNGVRELIGAIIASGIDETPDPVSEPKEIMTIEEENLDHEQLPAATA